MFLIFNVIVLFVKRWTVSQMVRENIEKVEVKAIYIERTNNIGECLYEERVDW